MAPFAITGTDTGGWLGEVTSREATTGELSLDPEAATCNGGGQSGLRAHGGHAWPRRYQGMTAYLCKRRPGHIRYLRRRHVYVALARYSQFEARVERMPVERRRRRNWNNQNITPEGQIRVKRVVFKKGGRNAGSEVTTQLDQDDLARNERHTQDHGCARTAIVVAVIGMVRVLSQSSQRLPLAVPPGRNEEGGVWWELKLAGGPLVSGTQRGERVDEPARINEVRGIYQSPGGGMTRLADL